MFNGQWNQDEYLIKEIFQERKNGVFVEIGSADPIHLSNSYAFEKYYDWEGVCIDARKSACEKLKAVRTSHIINAAIGPQCGKSIFLEFGVLSGIAKYMNLHEFETIEKHTKNFSNVPAYWLDVINLTDVLNKFNYQTIDLLLIDTEGAELVILESFQSELSKVSVVMTESNTLASRDKIRSFMTSNNFEYKIRLGMDDIFIRKDAVLY